MDSNTQPPMQQYARTTVFSYDPLNRQIARTDPLNHTWTSAFDGTGNLIGLTDPLSHTQTLQYDGANHTVAYVNALSKTWIYGVDAAGQQVFSNNPLNNTWTTSYDLRGRTSLEQDPLQNKLVYSYTLTGDRKSTQEISGSGSEPQTAVWSITWDALNQPVQYDDPNYLYDGSGSQPTLYDYTAAGDVLDSTGPDTGAHACNCSCCRPTAIAVGPTSAFDQRGQRVIFPDQSGHQTSFAYDQVGKRTAQTDPLNHIVTLAYDPQNRSKNIQTSPDGMGTTTIALAYDATGNLASVSDQSSTLSNTTSYFYDDGDRLAYVIDPAHQVDPQHHYTTYSYDQANRLTGITNRNGQTHALSYDYADQLTGEQWIDQNGATVSESYSYDDAGRLVFASDPYAAYTFSYDNADRLTGVLSNYGAGNPQMQLTYSYDGHNNRTAISDDRGFSTSYGYDLAHYLRTISWYSNATTQLAQVSFGYEFGPGGRNRVNQIHRTVPSGGVDIQTSTILYTNTNEVTQMLYRAGSSALATFNYTLDNADRLTASNASFGTNPVYSENLNYTYDNTNQLTSVSGSRTETYSYDLNGNRTRASSPALPNPSNFTYPQATSGNRLPQADSTSLTVSYQYDQDGNLLTKTQVSAGNTTTTAYHWDGRDRLAEVVVTQNNMTLADDHFTYDLFDRRVGKLVRGGTQQWTVYDGENTYADFSGTSLTTRYLYGDAVDQLFARYNGTTVSWYITDRLGSVREIVDPTGAALYTASYDSYGNIAAQGGTGGDRFGFTGREWDSEVALQYNRERYYDPTMGRWISEDPIGFLGSESNLYRYVGNRPLTATDPMGLDATPPGLLFTLDKGWHKPNWEWEVEQWRKKKGVQTVPIPQAKDNSGGFCFHAQGFTVTNVSISKIGPGNAPIGVQLALPFISNDDIKKEIVKQLTGKTTYDFSSLAPGTECDDKNKKTYSGKIVVELTDQKIYPVPGENWYITVSGTIELTVQSGWIAPSKNK